MGVVPLTTNRPGIRVFGKEILLAGTKRVEYPSLNPPVDGMSVMTTPAARLDCRFPALCSVTPNFLPIHLTKGLDPVRQL